MTTRIVPERLQRLYELRSDVEREIRAFEAAYAVDERDSVLQTVAAEFLMQPHEVLAQRQDERAVAARRVLVLMLRRRGLSYPQIGAFLGKHHTTVMHAERTANLVDSAIAARLNVRAAA